MKTRLILFLLAVIIGETLNQFALTVADPIMSTNMALGTVNGGAKAYALNASYHFTSTYVRVCLLVGYAILAAILFGPLFKSDRRPKQPQISNQ